VEKLPLGLGWAVSREGKGKYDYFVAPRELY
jgi:hypothetical protein